MKVVNETLRLGNVVRFLHRKAVKDVQYKGILIYMNMNLKIELLEKRGGWKIQRNLILRNEKCALVLIVFERL